MSYRNRELINKVLHSDISSLAIPNYPESISFWGKSEYELEEMLDVVHMRCKELRRILKEIKARKMLSGRLENYHMKTFFTAKEREAESRLNGQYNVLCHLMRDLYDN